MIDNKPLISLFRNLLLNIDFNNYFYKSGYDDEDITEFPYTFIGALNGYIKDHCFDDKYNIINHNDFVKQVIKGFEDLYGTNPYIDEVIIVGFIEGISQQVLSLEQMINLRTLLYYKDLQLGLDAVNEFWGFKTT